VASHRHIRDADMDKGFFEDALIRFKGE